MPSEESPQSKFSDPVERLQAALRGAGEAAERLARLGGDWRRMRLSMGRSLLDPALAKEHAARPSLRALVRRLYGLSRERGFASRVYIPRGLREVRDAIASAVRAAKRHRFTLTELVRLAGDELRRAGAADVEGPCEALSAMVLAGRGDDPLHSRGAVVALGKRVRKRDGDLESEPWQPRDVANEVIAWWRGDRHGGDSWERKIEQSKAVESSPETHPFAPLPVSAVV